MITKRHPHPAVAMLVALALAAVACSDDDASSPTTSGTGASTTSESVATTEPASSTSTVAPTTSASIEPPEPPSALVGAPRQLAPFAAFAGVPLLDGSTPFVGPPTPTSLADVDMAVPLREFIDGPHATDLKARVESEGFAIVPESGYYRYFHDAYDAAAYAEGTVFVTTDVAYHAWHQTFDKALRDTEEKVLVPALGRLLTGLVSAARAQAAELAGTASADAADRVVAYYEAAAVLLGLDVGEVDPRATETVRLATDAAEATTSPITAVKPCELPDAFTGCVDYTVFLPRGHYTRSEVLEQYFRAMSLLGQEAFYVDDADSMRMGLLASRLLDDDPELAAAWSTIYDATAFFVGVADDYTPLEAVSAAASMVPGGVAEAVTADATTILAIGERLLDSRDVGVDPENASVRTMGARAVLDSFVLDQLAWPNVGTDVDRRTEVSPLDLASVFGSALARQVQTAAGASDYLHYDEQLAAMTDLVQGRDAQDWAGTVYDGWLYALEPQFVPRTAAFPDYMRSDAWAAKSLQTGFGSYTELKHDTILYVKQGTAGEGEDTAPPFEPRHYVEPDPVAFGRIAAISQLALDGLGARGLLDDAATERFETLVELSSWLAGIAADELAGERTSDMDNERLRGIGFELELLWYETSDIEPFITIPQGDESAALVADIFRSSFDYLELGTGWIDTIYVIVPDGAGGFQLAQGGVYSYYEFWRPVDQQRLTDEEWRGMLLEGSQPERPAWQAPLFADLS